MVDVAMVVDAYSDMHLQIGKINAAFQDYRVGLGED